jgi:two-component system nitrogen regulation response regulator GlnG
VPVDSGAIPEALFEAELFGHEKGAFTGAVGQKAGRFEQANGGTLFLDEIFNMPLIAQAKVLRALQEKSFCRVGGAQPIHIDVRVLVAGNQDLDAAVAAGRLRADLFYRLNEFTLRVPPLRERKEDLIFLAKRFLDLTNQELEKTVAGFSEPAIRTLLNYPWPGNVRQLRSTIRRAVLLAGEVVTEQHLDILQANNEAWRRAALPARAIGASAGELSLKEIVARSTSVVEREVLSRALRQTGGNKSKAARLLRVDYKTIRSKIKFYGISSQEENYEEKNPG